MYEVEICGSHRIRRIQELKSFLRVQVQILEQHHSQDALTTEDEDRMEQLINAGLQGQLFEKLVVGDVSGHMHSQAPTDFENHRGLIFPDSIAFVHAIVYQWLWNQRQACYACHA